MFVFWVERFIFYTENKNMKSDQTHIFSIFYPELSALVDRISINQIIEIKDKNIRSRVVNVLRLKQGDPILFFDEKVNVKFVLHERTFKAKGLFFILKTTENNKTFKPEIILGVGLLKREFFENICYVAAQMGANKIIPVLTQRVHKNWINQKNKNRLKKIMISAAEQSKSFFIPQLLGPVNLKYFLNLDCNKKICFDYNGKKLIDLLQDLNKSKPNKIQLFFGSEAGFSDQEYKLISKSNFDIFKLTSTILRSVEAVTVGLGSIRSVV